MEIIEKAVFDHLRHTIKVPIFMESPITKPPSYVLIEKIGSSMTNRIQSSLFAFQSYAKSLHGAAELNNEVKQVVQSLEKLDRICSVKLNSDYNFTDQAMKNYRYQAVYDITHY